MFSYWNPTPREITEMVNAARKQVEFLSGFRKRMGIEMIEDGCPAKEIALAFGVSRTTVSEWRSALDVALVGTPRVKRDWLRGRCPNGVKSHFLRPCRYVSDVPLMDEENFRSEESQ